MAQKLLSFLGVTVLAVLTLSPGAYATPGSSNMTETDYSNAVLINESTGLSVPVHVNSTHARQQTNDSENNYQRFTQATDIQISAKELIAVGAISKVQAIQIEQQNDAAIMSSGSSTKTKHPLTATVGMNYDFKGAGSRKKIRVNRVFGSTKASYPVSIYKRSLVAGNCPWGNVLRKNYVPNSFSYATGWGWYDAFPGMNGARAILDIRFAPRGMAASNLTVVFYPNLL